jgi:hypothetical protein
VVQPLGEPSGPAQPGRQKFLRTEPVGDGAVPRAMGKSCTCGHGKKAHEHYRTGSDCSFCSCRRYHRPLLQRLGFGAL